MCFPYHVNSIFFPYSPTKPRYLSKMLEEPFNGCIYGSIFLSLFLIDYVLGNGFVEMFQKVFCKVTCFVKRTIREEAKIAEMTGTGNPISFPVLFAEILVLFLTMAVSLNLLSKSHEPCVKPLVRVGIA